MKGKMDGEKKNRRPKIPTLIQPTLQVTLQFPQAFPFSPAKTSNSNVAEFNGETATGVFKKFTMSSELAQ